MPHIGSAILALAMILAQAQPQPPAMPVAFLIVDNLEKAELFYHQLLGLEGRQGDPRARFAWFPMNAFLTDLYGVQGMSRTFFLRVPDSDLVIEPQQYSATTGKAVHPRLQ